MIADLEQVLRAKLSPSHADGLPCSESLYLYASGQLSAEESARFKLHLAECMVCRADLAHFRQTAEPQAAPTRSRWSSWRWLSLATAAAAVVMVAALVKVAPFGKRDGELRGKGGPHLHVGVRRGGEALAATDDMIFRKDDALGFFYSSPSDTWPLLYFCGQDGSMTRVFPQDAPTLMAAGNRTALSTGVVVEPARDCEWLVALFAPANERPSFDRVEQRLRQAVAGHGPDCTLQVPAQPGETVQIIHLSTVSP
jgi:hypothetical protein